MIKSYSEDDIHKASNITCGPVPLMATRSLTLRITKQLETSPPALFFSSSLYPNSSLRHITLENNENKPVTNSRDTQEQSFTASDKKATPKDKSKETSVIAEVAEEISQNGVAEVASTC
uniref:YTH domain-containing family protein n=1 Tax=Brassica oleracea var. oleracea TaxID=109376 RepID=A0A0D3AN32_BRAOL